MNFQSLRPFKFLSLCLFALLVSKPALARPGTYSGPILPATYEQLCAYDKMCDRILDPITKQMKPPKEMLLLIFERFRNQVFAVAKTYNVDPHLLVAVITTEHTLNVKVDDVLMSAFSRSVVGKDGNFLGIGVSYGFGQIYEEAALNAEPVVAEFEHRDVYPSFDQIQERLNLMEGALTYAAAIIVRAQRIYLTYGFDLSNKPGILASLYNLGKVDEYAQRTIKEKRLPQINFFGWYALYNWGRFHEALYRVRPIERISPKTIEQDKIITPLGYFYANFVLKKSFPIYTVPPTCARNNSWYDQSNSGNLRFNPDQLPTIRYKVDEEYLNTLNEEKLLSGFDGNGKFEIIQQSLGCKGDAWSLVRFESGLIGWISHKEVDRFVDIQYLKKACMQKNYLNCANEIRRLVNPKQILNEDLPDGVIQVQVETYKNAIGEIDIHNYRAECSDEKFRQDEVGWAKEYKTNNDSPFRKAWKIEPSRAAFMPQILRNDEIKYTPPYARKNLNLSRIYERSEIQNIRLKLKAIEKRMKGLYLNFSLPTQSDNGLNGNVIHLFSWYQSFDRVCQTQCIGPSVSYLDRFLKSLATENIRDLKVFQRLLDYSHKNIMFFQMSEIKETNKRNQEQSVQLNELNLNEQNRLIETQCKDLFRVFPEGRTLFNDLLAKQSAQTAHPLYQDLRYYGDRLSVLLANCEAYSVALGLGMSRAYDHVGAFKYASPSYASISVIDDQAMERERAKYGAKAHTDRPFTMFLNLSDFLFFNMDRELLKRSFIETVRRQSEDWQRNLQSANNYLLRKKAPATQSFYRKTCNYDPAQTAKTIEQISQLECVEKIYLPDDKFLIKKFGVGSAVGTYKIFDQPDRYEVQLKAECLDRK
jgi:hypothetical protein